MLVSIKIPTEVQTVFCSISLKKFLILKVSKSTLFVEIPPFIKLKKLKNYLNLSLGQKVQLQLLNVFSNCLKNIVNSLKIPAKKTLILKGLGLKTSIVADELHLKLGFSHTITLPLRPTCSILSGKNFVSIFGYNKELVGNLAEKIFKLKKADCYRGRGLSYKNKMFSFKPIKKT